MRLSMLTIDRETILKFDVPGPRYTSYPTAPNWNTEVNESIYIKKLNQLGHSSKTLSLYVHLPFCQSLCTFCACNVIIRKKEDKYADEYLKFLFQEIELVSGYIGRKKTIKQLHWGGGTPNFLTEEQIERLFKKTQEHFDIDYKGEVAIEIDPRTVTKNQIKELRHLGFNRISFGIQDFNPIVQGKVNRIQPFDLVKNVNVWCRELKFHSVNFDLIYGLPSQTPESFHDTVAKVVALRPERIALYSFAYVPWLKKHQNKIIPQDLPSNNAKLDTFLYARHQFLENGYKAIAMDHFALENDELAKAFHEGHLYRNFMGYTVKPADEYIGLGLTSIGFLGQAYIQNVKEIREYYRLLEENHLPVERGKVLSQDDKIRQWVINSFMCQFGVDKALFQKEFQIGFDEYFNREQEHIAQCLKDYLIQIKGEKITITEFGKIFIRNVCMGFDSYLQEGVTPKKFSRTV